MVGLSLFPEAILIVAVQLAMMKGKLYYSERKTVEAWLNNHLPFAVLKNFFNLNGQRNMISEKVVKSKFDSVTNVSHFCFRFV